jgi:tripartite ATP-independent transporter DctM subunit
MVCAPQHETSAGGQTMIIVFLGAFLLCMISGMPIAFSMIISSLCFVLAEGISLRIIVEKFLSGPDSFTLMAVPFFILAANLMNRGGITERIFDFANKMVGHITGGLGHVNIFASVIFSGMSGAAVADAGGLGQIELKAMRQAGFDDEFSLAVTGASSTIGPVIPPSIPAVVFCVTAGVSIGRVFIAGFLPGIVMALAMSVVVYFIALKNGYPVEPKTTIRQKLESFRRAFLSLMTPVIIIGGILSGVFTPTEAAIIASLYALFLGFFYRTLKLRDLKPILLETAVVTTGTILIIAAASAFGWVLSYERIPQTLSAGFLSIFTNKYIALTMIMVVLLIVGCFMETIAAITIMTPVLMPLVLKLGVDPVHFGVIMILNLMIGLVTPPVGLVLYTLSGISNVPFYRITKAMIPFFVILVVVLMLLIFIPQITLFLPGIVFAR